MSLYPHIDISVCFQPLFVPGDPSPIIGHKLVGKTPPFSQRFLEVTVALQLNNFWVLLPVNRGQKPRNLIVILILQTLDVPNISLETK